MTLHIKSVRTLERKNFRGWEPIDPEDVLEVVVVEIYTPNENEGDNFSLRLATPRGLLRMPAKNGILTGRPLLIIDSYSYDNLCEWLELTVKSCEADTWISSKEKLARYFDCDHLR